MCIKLEVLPDGGGGRVLVDNDADVSSVAGQDLGIDAKKSLTDASADAKKSLTVNMPETSSQERVSSVAAPVTASGHCDREYQLPKLSTLLEGVKRATKGGELNEEMSGSNLTQALEEIHTAARQRCAEATKARKAQRRENLKRELNDPSRGYAAFYGALRAEQMRPTSVLQTETGLGSLPTCQPLLSNSPKNGKPYTTD